MKRTLFTLAAITIMASGALALSATAASAGTCGGFQLIDVSEPAHIGLIDSGHNTPYWMDQNSVGTHWACFTWEDVGSNHWGLLVDNRGFCMNDVAGVVYADSCVPGDAYEEWYHFSNGTFENLEYLNRLYADYCGCGPPDGYLAGTLDGGHIFNDPDPHGTPAPVQWGVPGLAAAMYHYHR